MPTCGRAPLPIARAAAATDDTDPALATGPCLPSTDDTFIADLGATATVYADRVLGAAKDRDVVIVKSAGNSAAEFCTVDTTPTRRRMSRLGGRPGAGRRRCAHAGDRHQPVRPCPQSVGQPEPGRTASRGRCCGFDGYACRLLQAGADLLHPASASAAPPSPTIPPRPTMSRRATPIRCKGPMGSGTANCPGRRWPHRTSPVPSATCCS